MAQRNPRSDSPHGLVYGNCLRQNVENGVDDDEVEAHLRGRHEPALEVAEAHAVQQFQVGDLRLRDGLLGGGDQLGRDSPVGPADGPQRQPARRAAPQGPIAAERSSARGVRASTASSSACCRRATVWADDALNGFPGQVVDVGRRQRQDHPGPDADEHASLERLRCDGSGDPLGDQVVERAFGARGTFHRRPPEDVRLQDNDGPVEVGEGERLTGRCGVQERRHRRERGRRRRRRRLRLGADHAAVQECETQDEANPQPRGAAIPGSRAVRHAADFTRQ